jgi:hypothetical protein
MQRADIVKAFLGNPNGTYLADDVELTRTRVRIAGLPDVVKEVSAGPAGQAYRLASWSEPAQSGDVVTVVGQVPPNTITGEITVQFYFAGEKIRKIQHQALLPRPEFNSGIVLPDDVKAVIRGALADGKPFAIAHIDEDDTPVLTYRGSLTVIEDDKVALWARDANGGFVKAIQRNPNVAMIYRNAETHGYYNLKGRARAAEDSKTRELVQSLIPSSERQWDPAKRGVPVVIDLDRVEGWSGSQGTGPNVRVNMVRR